MTIFSNTTSTAIKIPTIISDTDLLSLRTAFQKTAAHFDQSGQFPHENFTTLKQAGLIQLVAPAPFGHGATLSQARKVIEAIAYAEPATALVLTMTYLNHRQLGRPDNQWPQVIRERVLQGGLINSLRVEPEQGSPSRGGLPDTVARKKDNGWLLSGQKIYSTGSPALEWMAVWARTDETKPRTGVFLVHRPSVSEGLSIVKNWDHLGLRASGSHLVVFDNVHLPDSHAIDLRHPEEWAAGGKAHTDLGQNKDQQAWMIVLLSTLYDAIARAARDWLFDFLRNRTPSSLGAPLSTLPRIQEQVGRIETLLYTNKIALDNLTEKTDRNNPPATSESGLVKYIVTNNAIKAVELALSLTGNHGLSRNNPLERHYRDVLCSRIHTPQNDSILSTAGRAALTAV